MSCGSGCGGSFGYPKADDRTSGSDMRPVNAELVRRQRAAQQRDGDGGGGGGGDSGGYRRFYSARLHRLSDRVAAVVAEPSSIQFREAAMAVLAVYALYRGLLVALSLHRLLARDPLGEVCMSYRMTALRCMQQYLSAILWIGAGWVGDVGMWGLAGAVAVFFAEEVFARVFPRKA